MRYFLIAFCLVFTTSFTWAAPSEGSVVVDKVTLTIDQKFYNSCLNSMKPYFDQLETCVVYEMPSRRQVFADAGFYVLMNFMVKWSQVTCQKDHLGQLYLRHDEYGDILISAQNKACLEKMANLMMTFKGPQTLSFYTISN